MVVAMVRVSVGDRLMRMRPGKRVMRRRKHVGRRRPAIEHEQKHHEQPRDRRDMRAKLGR